MTERVAVIGAGSRRCGKDILAAIMKLGLSDESELILCDIHHEALDLYDRLARAFAVESDCRFMIRCEARLEDALSEPTIIVLCFGIGVGKLDEVQAAQTTSLEIQSRLRAIRLWPTFERINESLHTLPEGCKVINLVRPVEYSSELLAHEAVHLEWPEFVTEQEKMEAVHQALRWVRTDDYPQFELKKHEESPLILALTEYDSRKVDRFNQRAIAQWMRDLEEVQRAPGSSGL